MHKSSPNVGRDEIGLIDLRDLVRMLMKFTKKFTKEANSKGNVEVRNV